MSSPFIGLLAIVSIFSGIYGTYGIIGILIIASSLLASEYLDTNLSFQVTTTLVVTTIIPMIISIYIWHIENKKSDYINEIDNIKNIKLTSQLEGITNQSDTIIKAIGDGVISIDSKGLIIMMNPAAERITGWSINESLNLNYKSILRIINQKGESIQYDSDPIAQCLNNNEQIINDDLFLQTKNNKKMMISLHISPAGQQGSGVIVVFRDITKEKTEEREQAEFISTASHEMRTPVASIEGYLGLALNPDTATLDNRARSFIEKAHESLQHLGRLFKDLLDVSKVDDNRINYIPKVTNIMSLIEDIVNGLRSKATEKKLELVFLPKPDNSGKYVVPVYFVNLDPDLITEVIGNLVENAIKYSPQGIINVNVVATDDNIKISVQDNGIGISEEDLPHLFQKFYRVNNSETNQIGGTGLGLYLSKKLVDRLGGQIYVESRYHKGSTFFVELPRISDEQAKQLMESQKDKIVTNSKLVENAKVQDILSVKSVISQNKNTNLKNISKDIDVTKPATNVPRGESLSRDQIIAKAKLLHEMAQTQAQPGAEISQNTSQKINPIINSRVVNVRIPSRNEN